jgi:hypothetical protein
MLAFRYTVKLVNGFYIAVVVTWADPHMLPAEFVVLSCESRGPTHACCLKGLKL